ncbi:hypothetical protein [Lentibacillus salicampi]|uniref:Uncharacterized protein n=1 Tax=Lentibacillus salicampi TaxID=175306 RepID=A0A4Y9A719_9BACI|nr:hypothetical protein [Lentibacillus salicampi]TFJ91519.1 hypothetical protein E4U82_17180 [Lentibacillus salicampi]
MGYTDGFIVNKPYKLYKLENYFKGINLNDQYVYRKNLIDDLIDHFDSTMSINNNANDEEFGAYLSKVEKKLNLEVENWRAFSDYTKKNINEVKNLVSKRIYANNREAFINLFDESKVISVDTKKIKRFGNILDTDGDKKEYHLNESGEGIFTELAKIKPFNDEDLINFSKKFGLPTGKIVNRGNETIEFLSCPTFHIHLNLVEFQFIFKIYVAICTNDTDLIKSIYLNLNSQFKGESEYRLDNLNKGAMLAQLKYDITIYLNNVLANRHEKVFNYNSLTDNFVETEKIHDLFHYAYIQLRHSLIAKSQIKKCMYCGNYFELQHGKQRFCPPLPFRKRSSCEMAYNREKNK